MLALPVEADLDHVNAVIRADARPVPLIPELACQGSLAFPPYPAHIARR